jgi:hypothetical protein
MAPCRITVRWRQRRVLSYSSKTPAKNLSSIKQNPYILFVPLRFKLFSAIEENPLALNEPNKLVNYVPRQLG